MSKTPEAGTQSKPGIFHLLKYCRIDRAAELLGCEVVDLLHLEEISEISLYWKFDGQPAIAKVKDVFAEKGEATKCFSDALPVVSLDDLGDISEGPENQKITLYGLWNAEHRSGSGYKALRSERVSCYGAEKTEWSGSFTARLPLDWQEPPVTELYIRKGDLYRLRDAIETGDPLQLNPDLPSYADKKISQIENQQVHRVTSKQCRALVGALLLAGLSKDDIKGSPGALQDKVQALANERGVGGRWVRDISECEPDTLVKWIERGTQ